MYNIQHMSAKINASDKKEILTQSESILLTKLFRMISLNFKPNIFKFVTPNFTESSISSLDLLAINVTRLLFVLDSLVKKFIFRVAYTCKIGKKLSCN